MRDIGARIGEKEKIQELEIRFVKWADHKTKKIQSQIEKVSKVKEKHIEDIVKNCSDHSKLVVKKLNHKKLRKKSLIQVKENRLNKQYMGNQ